MAQEAYDFSGATKAHVYARITVTATTTLLSNAGPAAMVVH